jgi:hypothetical protein
MTDIKYDIKYTVTIVEAKADNGDRQHFVAHEAESGYLGVSDQSSAEAIGRLIEEHCQHFGFKLIQDR